MTKEKLKQKFSNLYKKRESFYESHRDMAAKIGFEDWQKNEFFQYFYEGAKDLEKENAELKELLSLVYKGLISYKTNPNNLAVEGTFEMEKSVFMDWLHRVKPFVTEGEVEK